MSKEPEKGDQAKIINVKFDNHNHYIGQTGPILKVIKCRQTAVIETGLGRFESLWTNIEVIDFFTVFTGENGLFGIVDQYNAVAYEAEFETREEAEAIANAHNNGCASYEEAVAYIEKNQS